MVGKGDRSTFTDQKRTIYTRGDVENQFPRHLPRGYKVQCKEKEEYNSCFFCAEQVKQDSVTTHLPKAKNPKPLKKNPVASALGILRSLYRL